MKQVILKMRESGLDKDYKWDVADKYHWLSIDGDGSGEVTFFVNEPRQHFNDYWADDTGGHHDFELVSIRDATNVTKNWKEHLYMI